ncbi:MAG: hypothetical protein IPM29_20705 [Planctomycetes bacterium]|nr:hypothetical protein [Planctomycetota bacterium]
MRVRSRVLTTLRALLIGAVFLAPYSTWAHARIAPFAFPSATALLALLLGSRGPRTTVSRLGLAAGPRTWIAALAVALLVHAGAHATIGTVSRLRAADLQMVDLGTGGLASFVFQTLNEEVLLGFLPLAALARRWPRRPLAIATALAAAFAGLHVALYRFGGLQTPLAPVTVVTLFAVGALRNALILRCGHIALAWALHAGFNLALFRTAWQSRATGAWLNEAERFDVVLGAPWLAAATACAALAAFAELHRHARRRDAAPAGVCDRAAAGVTDSPGSPG